MIRFMLVRFVAMVAAVAIVAPVGVGVAAEPQADREAASVFVKRGQEMAAQGRRDEALDAFRQALTTYPAYPLAFHELGVTLAEAGDLAGAEANLRKALELAPDFQRAQQALGEVLRRQKRFEESLPWYTSALKQNAVDAAAWYGLAASLQATKRPGEALWALQRLIAALPNSEAPLAVEAQKAADAAIDADVKPIPWPGIDEAVAGAKGPESLPRHAGDDAFERREYVSALTTYLGLSKTKDGEKDGVLAYKIGAVYAIMNEARLAVGWWRKALALAPEREIIGRHLALLIARQRAAEIAAGGPVSGDAMVRAKTALLGGDPATALFLVKGSSAPEAAVLEGEARLQLGDFVGARGVFEAILAKEPDHHIAKGGLAEALVRGPTFPRSNDLAQKTLKEWLGDDEARPDAFLVLRKAELDARILMPAPPEDELE